jgi:hypothetical protein
MNVNGCGLWEYYFGRSALTFFLITQGQHITDSHNRSSEMTTVKCKNPDNCALPHCDCKPPEVAASAVDAVVVPEFEREFRYLVMKFKDVNKYLTDSEKEILLTLTKRVAEGRCDDGKMPLDCVVVESDWPEYEPTWAAIEQRMKA